MNRSHAIALITAFTALVGAVGCNDQDVPFLTAPTAIPNTPVGMKNGVTGLFSGTRSDMGGYIGLMSGFARQAAVFTNTEPRPVQYNTGFSPMPNTWTPVWANEYTDILQAHNLLAKIPQVVPAYTTAQAAALTGVIQTLEAYNYMIVEEVHDTLGAAILGTNGGTTPPPAFCNKDMWQYIIALLDSANAQLNAAGAVAAPITWPSGFGGVNGSSGPSTAKGSFASFNRALAGKANFELAYAIARAAGGASVPTPTTTGAPDQAALTRADSAMNASALFSPGSLGPNPVGGWVQDGFSVFHDYSGTSGDEINPMNANYTTFVMLKSLIDQIDTTTDLRWKAKFGPMAAQYLPIQQPTYNSIAVPFFYTPYSSPGSFIPIVRNEELTLVEAEIQIGMGNYSNALNLINDVRTLVAGQPAYTFSADYITTRDTLLKEIDISTANEAGGDRMIAIRNYGMVAVVDTDWAPHDAQTSIDPIPFAEVSGRGGSWSPTCQ